MNKEKLYEAIGDINENYVRDAHTAAKAKKPVWMKWAAVAACFCLCLCGVLGIGGLWSDADDRHQFDVAQAIRYNGHTYYVCGSEGEGSIIRSAGLPDELTADLAGTLLGYLKPDDGNGYIVADEETDIQLFEYAPQPNENVYILMVDGDCYAVIRRDNGTYQGLPQASGKAVHDENCSSAQ